MATRKGLEPSTSSVTGWHSNRLNYRAVKGWWAFRVSNPGPSGYEPPALTTELKAPEEPTRRKNGDPEGNRTPVIAVKGRCLDLLTTGPEPHPRKNGRSEGI